MPIIKTVAFGRMWRYTCDIDGCEERHTVAPNKVPDGWHVIAESAGSADVGEVVLCPTHINELDAEAAQAIEKARAK